MGISFRLGVWESNNDIYCGIICFLGYQFFCYIADLNHINYISHALTILIVINYYGCKLKIADIYKSFKGGS